MKIIKIKPIQRILEATYKPCLDKQCDLWLLPEERLTHWVKNHKKTPKVMEVGNTEVASTMRGVFAGVVPLKKYCGRGMLLFQQKRSQGGPL